MTRWSNRFLSMFKFPFITSFLSEWKLRKTSLTFNLVSCGKSSKRAVIDKSYRVIKVLIEAKSILFESIPTWSRLTFGKLSKKTLKSPQNLISISSRFSKSNRILVHVFSKINNKMKIRCCFFKFYWRKRMDSQNGFWKYWNFRSS